MVVTTLYSMENEPAVTGACPFADVASGSYCEDAITWAAANGIVSGYSAAAFGQMQWAVAHELICGVGGSAIAPQATATRAEPAVVLHRFCEAFA